VPSYELLWKPILDEHCPISQPAVTNLSASVKFTTSSGWRRLRGRSLWSTSGTGIGKGLVRCTKYNGEEKNYNDKVN
jgi:hypothetical protein